MSAWILTIVLLAACALQIDLLLGILCPRLTPWQRTRVVVHLGGAVGFASLAWQAGAR